MTQEIQYITDDQNFDATKMKTQSIAYGFRVLKSFDEYKNLEKDQNNNPIIKKELYEIATISNFSMNSLQQIVSELPYNSDFEILSFKKAPDEVNAFDYTIYTSDKSFKNYRIILTDYSYYIKGLEKESQDNIGTYQQIIYNHLHKRKQPEYVADERYINSNPYLGQIAIDTFKLTITYKQEEQISESQITRISKVIERDRENGTNTLPEILKNTIVGLTILYFNDSKNNQLNLKNIKKAINPSNFMLDTYKNLSDSDKNVFYNAINELFITRNNIPNFDNNNESLSDIQKFKIMANANAAIGAIKVKIAPDAPDEDVPITSMA